MVARALPQELTDAIIDILRNDKRTLTRCALVSKDWNARATKHIWRSILLSARATIIGQLPNLYASPALLSRIETLFCLDAPTSTAQGLLDHLPAFSHLTTLILRRVIVTIPIRGDAPLSRTVRTLKLSRVQFEPIRACGRLIARLPALLELCLVPSLLCGPSDNEEDESPPAPLEAVWRETTGVHLTSLTVDINGSNSGPVLHSLFSTIPLRPKDLRIVDAPFIEVLDVGALWSVLLPSVEILHWDTEFISEPLLCPRDDPN